VSFKIMEKVLAEALQGLDEAQKKMQKTKPQIALPRPRKFVFCKDVEWPYQDTHDGVLFSVMRIERGDGFSKKKDISPYELRAYKIIEKCKCQPRLVLRALRRIQAATAWCEARTEGRKRHAEEILRQQAKAIETLEAEAAMLALK
jgi:hypothetical protein